MAFCENCGTRLPEKCTVCPSCGEAVASGTAQPEESTSYRAAQSATKGIVSPFGNELYMAENEQIVRQYLCSKIRHPRCEGHLTVTNKRLLFHGESETSRVSKEVALDSVSGLDCFYGMNINVPGLIIGALLAIVGLIFLKKSTDGPIFLLIALVAIAIAVLVVVRSLRTAFFLSVFSSKASGTPISIGQGARSMLGNGALYTLASTPTHDTDRMINELGALVQDLQTLGDHAIEKWHK